MDLLPDRSSKVAVMNGCVRLGVVQNFELVRMVVLQYRQTWVRATIAFPYFAGTVTRNPVLFVRPASDRQA